MIRRYEHNILNDHDMSNFENFLCFPLRWRSVMEREVRRRMGTGKDQKGKCGGEGKRRKSEERKQRNFQNRSYHLIIDERNEKRL